MAEDKISRATLRIPFDSVDSAEIAYSVLNVDHEPSRSFVQKQLTLDGSTLVVLLSAEHVKNLRVAVTSFFESLMLYTETVKEFKPN